jgi:hypothetical protein
MELSKEKLEELTRGYNRPEELEKVYTGNPLCNVSS